MSTGRSKLSWRTAAAVAAASAVIGIGAWSAVGEEPAGPRLDTRAERIMYGRETRQFDTLEQLVGSTPYIVKATVTDIQPGRSVGDAESGGVEQARDVTLAVEVKYKKALLPSTLVVEEWGWDSEGAGYQVENVAWSKVGDKGYYFLTKSSAADRYKLINTQGRALETSDGMLELSADPDSDLATYFNGWTSVDLAGQIMYLLRPENSDQLQTVPQAPAAPTASMTAPAAEDGTEEPYPDDSVDDGSEPSASPTS
ncbi:hypothetical protein SAMN06272735_2983 [Streptomyces sp. TLI_55]|uniref:hypothetical protein n=1 Tax=Streptomyces sp. TLI_55 TaxID=1938861 RepID=UPI000BC41D99|nr:hypothetical protein [Streptomyces sp. TLI_55]SNX58487.1 hypothetical protein SAMN06272735_2983 [Streptomyces sp. TLI_55]